MSSGDEESIIDDEKSAWREFEQEYFKHQTSKVSINVNFTTNSTEYQDMFDMSKHKGKISQLMYYKEDPFMTNQPFTNRKSSNQHTEFLQ